MRDIDYPAVDFNLAPGMAEDLLGSKSPKQQALEDQSGAGTRDSGG